MKKIKRIDDFLNLVSEAFDNPLDIKWINKGNILRGLFSVNDHIYQIVCEDKGNNIWKYDFYFYEENKKFSPELTGFEKDKFRVLPTIKSGIQYLYDNRNINAIIFGSSDNSKGRKKIYESFCKLFCDQNNLDFYTKVHSNLDENIDRQIFIMFKKDMDKDILSDVVIKILEEEKF
jgi:hypothetical protein